MTSNLKSSNVSNDTSLLSDVDSEIVQLSKLIKDSDDWTIVMDCDYSNFSLEEMAVLPPAIVLLAKEKDSLKPASLIKGTQYIATIKKFIEEGEELPEGLAEKMVEVLTVRSEITPSNLEDSLWELWDLYVH